MQADLAARDPKRSFTTANWKQACAATVVVVVVVVVACSGRGCAAAVWQQKLAVDGSDRGFAMVTWELSFTR